MIRRKKLSKNSNICWRENIFSKKLIFALKIINWKKLEEMMQNLIVACVKVMWKMHVSFAMNAETLKCVTSVLFKLKIYKFMILKNHFS